jgi:phospholipid transport system substrate-binding protein
MLKTMVWPVLTLAWALAAPLSVAQDVAPDVMLKAITLEVIGIVRQDKDIQAGNPAKVAELIETKILPLFDFSHMTQLAMARNWRLATSAQQQVLILEFKTLLVRTYSVALSTYRDWPIEFKRMRATPGETAVTVRTAMKQSASETLTMDYDMEKSAVGWKVYDIKIDGISLITTYRQSFAGKVRTDGIDGLIKSLSDKNRQGEIRMRSSQNVDQYFAAIVSSVLQGAR